MELKQDEALISGSCWALTAALLAGASCSENLESKS